MNSPHKTKVLILDDDASFRRILELRLKALYNDLELKTFEDLTSIRAYLRSEKPEDIDLIIQDEHLPDGRGIELLMEGWFEGMAVLCMSSDNAPEIPGATIKAGAAYFLSKTHVSDALFEPLVRGIIDRNVLQRQLNRSKIESAVIQSVKTLVSTLQHEINNPLGAVLGAAYIMRNSPNSDPSLRQTAELVESSGRRIKHVLDQLCEAMALEPVTKGNQKVFHIPGDQPWIGSEESKDKPGEK